MDSLQLTFPLPYRREYSYKEIELPFRLKLNPEYKSSPLIPKGDFYDTGALWESFSPELSGWSFQFSTLWRQDPAFNPMTLRNPEQTETSEWKISDGLGWQIPDSSVRILFTGAYMMGQP